MSVLKRTSLYPLYKEYGAKKVAFSGWEMPVYFSGIKKEHHAVRQQAGLFDVSHMGEAIVKGSESYTFLQYVITNDLERLEPGKVMYTFLCNENGGVVDDLLIYQLDENCYMLVLNAVNIKKDLNWLIKHSYKNVEIKDMSDYYSLLAIQGPKAEKILQCLTDEDLSKIQLFRFQKGSFFNCVNCIVSRTGYTGEDGFEIYCKAGEAPSLWQSIITEGENEGLLPCGLAARDTLRFEAGLPLYGHEISETISPLEAGFKFAVKLQKHQNFIGKDALLQEKQAGIGRQLMGLELMEKGVPRSGYNVLDESGYLIGKITSGTHSPTLGLNVGMALVDKSNMKETTTFYVQVRKKTLEAKDKPLPFYKRRTIS
ncbi:glycine cleavage system aminomethyltransferase GcvT [Salibacterium salarium]|uniref:Aminomethyltransferase n=1 Tax=Salibacterium salarium TaxID=284579 RepID=A0A428N8I4_9BACI|nr:glycine cleavage system aminomethyltransferase GcvT [Salibacterium salarium]RSL34677.1 glycine cleavage system aminomethyltransferase GcvT [Salibacterium salarium]